MNFSSFADMGIALLYFTGALVFLAGVLGQNNALKRGASWITVLGFCLHTLALGLKTAVNPLETITQGHFYFSLLAWSLLLIYLILWRRLRLQFMALTAAPLALILFTPSILITTRPLSIPSTLSSLWFGLHIGALFLSLALLALGFGAGLFYLYMNRQLKDKKKPGRFRRDIPSLATFDKLNSLTVSIGFPFFTLGLLSGFIWAGFTWGEPFSWDPKELISIFIWLIFAYLFHQRKAIGWKGRKPANLTIVIFLLCLASLMVNFFVPTHHGF
jgi:cytochrome c-type biogenesis protein CcsB